MSKSIYVIEAKGGPVKIGISGSPKGRRAQLQATSDLPLALRYAAQVEKAFELEQRAHEILSDHRSRGEWFGVDVETAIMAIAQAALDLSAALKPYDPLSAEATDDYRVQVQMRMRPSLKAIAEKAARAEGRSLSSLIERGLIMILRETTPQAEGA